MTVQKVQAHPTKEFFIFMITKDIKLERAIIDLIDNSIDGAKNIRGEENFEGLYVNLTINKDEFIIEDNCGGFDLETAKKYAFMFGRPDDPNHISPKHSVGRFGIGMKRALFKMGEQFEVESKHKKDHFQVNVDTTKWLRNPKDWTFEYEQITEHNRNIGEEDGTYIRVQELAEDVINEFSSESFLSSLTEEIERALNFPLEKNLSIRLNGSALSKKGIYLLENENLKPYFKEIIFKNGSSVNAKIYAGLGKASPDDGGWYIYCNDRLVLAGDKSNLTGWEGRRFGESTVRKYHNYFAMFRGVVFFDSDDAKKLPMNTTKTGIDSNSSIYQITKEAMIDSMIQITGFLNQVATEEEEPIVYRENLVNSSNQIDVIELKKMQFSDSFKSPTIEEQDDSEKTHTTVAYWVDKNLIKKVKKNLGVSSNKEVGERTFDYFLDMEGIKRD